MTGRKKKHNSLKKGVDSVGFGGGYGEYKKWLEGEDNSLQRERLFKNLRRAKEEELTERQKVMIEMHFDRKMSMRSIAKELGVAPSTVSRTIARAKARIERSLKYSF